MKPCYCLHNIFCIWNLFSILLLLFVLVINKVHFFRERKFYVTRPCFNQLIDNVAIDVKAFFAKHLQSNLHKYQEFRLILKRRVKDLDLILEVLDQFAVCSFLHIFNALGNAQRQIALSLLVLEHPCDLFHPVELVECLKEFGLESIELLIDLIAIILFRDWIKWQQLLLSLYLGWLKLFLVSWNKDASFLVG